MIYIKKYKKESNKKDLLIQILLEIKDVDKKSEKNWKVT